MAKKKKEKPKYLPILAVNYAATFAWGSFAPFFAIVIEDLGGSPEDIGYIWGAYALMTGILMIIFGHLEDHSKHMKRILFIASLFLLAASGLYVFADSVSDAVIAQMVYAVGFGMFTPAIKKVFSLYQDKGKEATEWALLDGGNMLLMSAAAIIGGFIFENYGADGFYLFVSTFLGLNTLMIARLKL